MSGDFNKGKAGMTEMVLRLSKIKTLARAKSVLNTL
jgi:hypothetical protein